MAGGGSSTSVKKGDVNGDGRITLEDLARMKMHLIDKELLTGNSYTAGDINSDGRITLEDLARVKMHLIGLLEIK